MKTADLGRLLSRNVNLRRARAGQHGGALLAVLWLSAALAAIAFSVSSTVRTETERVSTSAEGLRASYLAQGAVERAIQWMVWGPAYRNPDGSPKFWDVNQPRLNMTFPSGAAVVEVIPETAKLNINTAAPDDLYRVVFAVSGDAERSREITAAIVDWRGAGDGAASFDQFYFGISPTFRARHASFQEIEELLLVRGMTPELFYGNYTADSDGRLFARGGLRDCLSPWGSAGPFDANTASPALLEAVGVAPADVAALVAQRQMQPFRNLGDVTRLTPYTTRLTVGGGRTIFTLRATARLRRPDNIFSDVVRTASATVKMLDPRQPAYPAVVLRWYEDAWSQAVIPPTDNTSFSSGNLPAGTVPVSGAALP
jgi:general secretion pathway protein K